MIILCDDKLFIIFTNKTVPIGMLLSNISPEVVAVVLV